MNRDQVVGFLAWLRVQLDDDELVARRAPGPRWVKGIERAGSPGHWRGVKAHLVMLPADNPFDSLATGDEVLRADSGADSGQVFWAVDHAVRHDPARVLREVESTRELIRAYENAVSYTPSVVSYVRGQDSGYAEACLDVLRSRAEASYGDRDGWQAGWRL